MANGSVYRSAVIFIGASALMFGMFINVALADTTSALSPMADGVYQQWQGAPLGSHYQQVDETPCNGNDDYVSTNAVGARDSYSVLLDEIPVGSVVNAIEITPCASQNIASTSASRLGVFFVWNSGTSGDIVWYTPSGFTPMELTPAVKNVSYYRTTSSTLQVGAKLVSGANGVRLSRLAARITYTPLTAPANLVAINVSSTRNDLSWTDTTSVEQGYRVQRSIFPNSGFVTIAPYLSANTTSYSDLYAKPNLNYYYRVGAYNPGGVAYSDAVAVVSTPAAPAAPTNLAVQVVTGTTTPAYAFLWWTDNSRNEEGFKVERGTDGISFAEVGTSGINYAAFRDLNLAPGTYYYRVRAWNAVGDSGYSNIVSALVP